MEITERIRRRFLNVSKVSFGKVSRRFNLLSETVKCNSQHYACNQRFASPTNKIQYIYPHSNEVLLISPLTLHHFARTAMETNYVKPDVNQ